MTPRELRLQMANCVSIYERGSINSFRRRNSHLLFVVHFLIRKIPLDEPMTGSVKRDYINARVNHYTKMRDEDLMICWAKFVMETSMEETV